MSPWYAAYASVGAAVFISSAPLLWLYSRLNRRFTKGWKEKLGFLPKTVSGLGAPIWLHASSLGEVRVADAIMSHLRDLVPEKRMILSVNTDYGFESAKAVVRKTPVVYAPFFREVLKHVDAFSMITEEDGDRILAMGADPKKVEVHGNAKHDLLARQADPSAVREMRRLLDLGASDTVFVAGSTREGEEEKVLEVYSRLEKKFPGIILVIAPRHVTRTPGIENLLKRRNLPYQLRSDLHAGGARRTAPVLILDTFGDLFKVYSVGTINFCGASLVPKGGQNPMEAAVWGKAVFYGPHMEDFIEARTLLERAGGGISVKDAADFSEKAVALLNQREFLAFLGERARRAVLESRGAAERHAGVIARMIQKHGVSA